MLKIGTLADWFGVGLINGIKESQRCGAQGVQVYAANELDPRTVTREQIKTIKGTAQDCEQKITALCGELGGHGLQVAQNNPQNLDYLMRTIDLALELDCNIVTTHIGVIPEDSSHPRYQVMLDAGRKIGEFAANSGAHIAIETGPEIIKTLKMFVDDCEKGIAINYDPANIVMVTRDDEVQGVHTAGKAIVHTHAKDGRCNKYIGGEAFYNKVFADDGLDAVDGNFCTEYPLGMGDVRWQPYIKALQAIGYDGYLTIEREVKNGAEDIRMAVNFLKELLATV